MSDDPVALHTAEANLVRYGLARNRSVDREPRQVILTDDEARALIHEIERLRGLLDGGWDHAHPV